VLFLDPVEFLNGRLDHLPGCSSTAGLRKKPGGRRKKACGWRLAQEA
jgi:hypothetical protein